MGINASPAIFSREITKVMAPASNAVGYMDDWLLAGKNAEELKANTEIAIRLLTSKGMRINWEKSMFNKEVVPFLGHIISARNGIQNGPDTSPSRGEDSRTAEHI